MYTLLPVCPPRLPRIINKIDYEKENWAHFTKRQLSFLLFCFCVWVVYNIPNFDTYLISPVETNHKWYQPLSSLKFLLLPRNTMTKKKVGEGRVYLAYPSTLLFITEEVRTGIQTGQDPGVHELIQRPWRGAAYCLAPHGFLSLLSYRTQDHQHRNGTTHYWLGLPLSITRWDNTLQLDLKEAFPQPRLLPLPWP